MSEAILSKLMRVTGITGAAIFDTTGRCAGLAGSVEQGTMQQLVTSYERLIAKAVSIDNTNLPTRICVQFADGSIFIEQHGDWLLVITASKETNDLMLNAARSYAANELSKQPVTEVRRSASLVDTRTVSGLATPTVVGRAVVDHIVLTYERYLGARARFLLEEEMERLGATAQSLRFEQVADLLKAAANRIPNSNHRARFISEALGDVQ